MVTITIDTDNAAFHDDDGKPSDYAQTMEVARILRKLVHKLESGLAAGSRVYATSLMDYNGNRVGSFSMDPPCTEEDLHEEA